jgi:signal peptidase II
MQFLRRRLELDRSSLYLLLCAGGIGNLLDRVRYDGYVTDFLNMSIGPLRTGIFNLADVALMAGIVLFMFQHVNGEDTIARRVVRANSSAF